MGGRRWGLYLRESSERAGDLLLWEERVVYTVPILSLYRHQALLFFSLPVHSSSLPSSPLLSFPLLSSSLLSSPLLSSSFLFVHLFLSLTVYTPRQTAPLPPSCCLPVFLQSFALFDLSLSLHSPGCIQVKLLIASAVGGLRQWLSAAQLLPVQGAAGLLKDEWFRVGLCLACAGRQS